LTSDLVALGLPLTPSQRMSDAYMRRADELKTASQAILHATASKLASLPRPAGVMPLVELQKQLFEAHHSIYKSTLSRWAQTTLDLARTHSDSHKLSANAPPKLSGKKPRRQFKSVSCFQYFGLVIS
jgi:hypothetical protein